MTGQKKHERRREDGPLDHSAFELHTRETVGKILKRPELLADISPQVAGTIRLGNAGVNRPSLDPKPEMAVQPAAGDRSRYLSDMAFFRRRMRLFGSPLLNYGARKRGVGRMF